MQQTAEVIKFERAIVKADINDGFDRVAGKLTDTLMNPPVNLCGREYRVIQAVISKTYRYHKKMDWISTEQLSELTGIDASNVPKVKNGLINKKVLIKDGRKIGINPVVSEWLELPKTVKNDLNEISQKRLLNKSKMTEFKSKTTVTAVKNDPHNRKTNIQKTITTLDKPAKRKTQVPQNFIVTDEMRAWALQNQISVDLKTETEQFIDHYTGKGEGRLDWVASWRTWMRNSKRFTKPNTPPSNRAKPESFTPKNYAPSTFNFEESL